MASNSNDATQLDTATKKAERRHGAPYVPPTSQAKLRGQMVRDTTNTPAPRSATRRRRQDQPTNSDTMVAPWLVKMGRSSWYLIGIGIIAIGIITALLQVTYVVVAIFVAFILTALLNPFVNWASKYMKRWMAVILALVGLALFFSGLLTFVVASVAGQWSKLTQQVIDGVDKIIDFLNKTPFKTTMTADDVFAYIQDLIQRAEKYATDNWKTLVGKIASNAGAIGIVFTVIALAIFVTIFFLASGANMWRWFLNMLPTDWRANTNRAAQAGWNSFSGYARGTVLIALIDGALAWILLEILAIPLAPALGVLVSLGAFIPLIGAPAAMLVAMVVALAVDGIWKAVAVGIGIALIGQLEGHVLQPLIMGHQVSLSPLVIGIGVVTGTLVGGLLGAILVVPLMGVTWAVFTALYHKDPPIEGPLPGSMPPQKYPEGTKRGILARLWPFSKKTKEAPALTSAPAADAS